MYDIYLYLVSQFKLILKILKMLNLPIECPHDDESSDPESPSKRKREEFEIVDDDFKISFPSPVKEAKKFSTSNRFAGQIINATLCGSTDIRYIFIVPYNQRSVSFAQYPFIILI